MSWWNIIKAHPRLVQLLGDKDELIVQLANEAEVVELFNASNPQVDPYETRAAKGLENDYPIDTFFGVVKRVEGEPRLVAVGGYAKRKGKNSQRKKIKNRKKKRINKSTKNTQKRKIR